MIEEIIKIVNEAIDEVNKTQGAKIFGNITNITINKDG